MSESQTRFLLSKDQSIVIHHDEPLALLLGQKLLEDIKQRAHELAVGPKGIRTTMYHFPSLVALFAQRGISIERYAEELAQEDRENIPAMFYDWLARDAKRKADAAMESSPNPAG
jgi:hypothetical protein